MKNGWKRIAAAMLTLALILSLLPLPEMTGDALAAGSYGRVTQNGVRVRKKASTGADYWFKLDKGYVCAVTGTLTEGGIKWYKVTAEHPDPNSTRTYVGYIHGDYFVMLTDEEAAEWEANPVQQVAGTNDGVTGGGTTNAGNDDAPTQPAPGNNNASTNGATTSGARGEITNSGVNFRETEGGPVIQKLERGTVVELLTLPAAIDSDHWYRVRYNNQVGYIQAPFIRVISTGNLTAGNDNTNVPTGQYVKLILSSANLRLSPGGTVGAQWENRGGTLPVMGSAVKQGGYTWYPVQYENKTYYVRGDCVQLVTSVADAPATPTPAPQTSAKYVKLVLSSANLRTTPGGKVGAQWETTGEVLAVNGAAVKQGGYTWYPVKYNGNNYYVRGDCVQVVASLGNATATATPTPVVTYKGYVKTLKGGVNLRLKPAGEYIQQVEKNLVLPVLADVVQQAGYGWYYVTVDGVKGYLRGDCVVVCDKNGNPLASTVTTPPSAGTSSYGYVKLNQDKINLRAKPAGSSIEQLPMGQVLPMTGNAVKSGAYTWYPVRATSGKTGYVRGDCADPCDKNGTLLGSTATDAPAVDTGATYGYIKTTTTSVNVRKTPAGTKVTSVGKNEVFSLTGNPTTKSGYTWYPVKANGVSGYIRSDCAITCDKNGNALNNSDTNTATVNYVQTTVDQVNLRASASKDANAPYNVALGTVMAYNNVKTVGGSKWYRVVYNNTEVWVLSSCVKVMTAAEYQAYIDSKPVATPQPEVVKGYVITTTSGVNLRTAANGATIIGRIDKNVVMPYAKEPEVVRGYTWYYVKSPNNGYGYVRGDCVDPCQQNGKPLPTVPPTTVGGNNNAGKPEASYTTLKRGSTGSAVKALVAELKAQGYYTGAVTSTYTSAVETAVKAFQRAKGLTADGIAGSKTQHALFGTVETGSSDTSNLTMAIYPAEKIDWYTGGINAMWAKGANYKVYDVKTGIVWWAHRWSGGSHVDAEPLTAADTARLCKIYGVSNADQIASKNLWQRRPLLITIGNRTFAASMYGIPHNYPDGDTISTNNFKGQLCIHFSNSKTHASNKVDTYHTEAIDYAWRNAPNGHK